MRGRFPGYYRPTEAEFKSLWDTCFFIPDANVLLHLFRYGDSTRRQVLLTFEALRSRLWVPYWVGFEFNRRWREVDLKNRSAYADLAEKVTSAGNSMKALFNEYSRHQLIDADQEREEVEKFVSGICSRLKELEAKHPAVDVAVSIHDEISNLVGEAIGERLSEVELDAIYKEGEERYKKKIPPGFRDANSKKDNEIYGDLVIWKEMIAKAKADQRGVIFITDDLKDDWWHDFKGAKLGPRPELVEEFQRETHQPFYMYSLAQFLENAGLHLNKTVDRQAIQEIEEDETTQRKLMERVRAVAVQRHTTDLVTREAFRVKSRLHEVQAKLEELRSRIDLVFGNKLPISDDNMERWMAEVHRLRSEREHLRAQIKTIQEVLEMQDPGLTTTATLDRSELEYGEDENGFRP